MATADCASVSRYVSANDTVSARKQLAAVPGKGAASLQINRQPMEVIAQTGAGALKPPLFPLVAPPFLDAGDQCIGMLPD